MSRIIKQHGPEQFAAFASPSSTLEELYLLQKLMRELGIENLDHRIQQVDFRDQEKQATTPTGSLKFSELENQQAILLVGTNIDREVPLVGIKTRKAFRNGSKIFSLNPVDYDYRFPVSEKLIVSPEEMAMELAKLALALIGDPTSLPEEMQRLFIGLKPDNTHLAIAKALKEPNAAIISGALFENHPDASLLRTLVYLIEQNSEVRVLRLTAGANSAGACLAGMLPHRSVASKSREKSGLDVQSALEAKLKGYFLLAVEPGLDFANPYGARQSMLAAEFVVMLTAFENESMLDYANVILPIAPYAETSGTYLNVDSEWQSVKGAQAPFGEARPAWKILRVMANLFHCKEFNYVSTEEVLEEIKTQVAMASEYRYEPYYPEFLPSSKKQLVRVGEWPLYRCDMIVRHAQALQECAAADKACIRIHPKTADRLKLDEIATVSQGDIEITLPLERDQRMAEDVVWVANAMPETVDLGHAFAAITIKR